MPMETKKLGPCPCGVIQKSVLRALLQNVLYFVLNVAYGISSIHVGGRLQMPFRALAASWPTVS